jgi:hypothetical protein
LLACLPRTFAKADSTLRSSQAVPHPSTNRALRRLTSEVERDPVYSTRYGRQRNYITQWQHMSIVNMSPKSFMMIVYGCDMTSLCFLHRWEHLRALSAFANVLVDVICKQNITIIKLPHQMGQQLIPIDIGFPSGIIR